MFIIIFPEIPSSSDLTLCYSNCIFAALVAFLNTSVVKLPSGIVTQVPKEELGEGGGEGGEKKEKC